MVDFVGRTPAGIYDEMQGANQYWNEAHNAAQSRWQNREMRRRYDEGNRLNRQISSDDAAAYAQQAGLFESMDGAMAGTTRRNVPSAAAPDLAGGPMQLTPTPTGLTPAVAPAPAPRANAQTPANTAQAPAVDAQADIINLNDLQPLPFTPRNASQRTTLNEYNNRVNDIRSRHLRNMEPVRRTLDRMVATGMMSQQEANVEAYRIAQAAGLYRNRSPLDVTQDPMAGIVALNQEDIPEVDAGANTAPDAAGLATAQEFIGEDTSRSMQPTREMQLLRANVENQLRRAQTYAQHGRADLGAEAFNAAMQGQVAYMQQGLMTMMRAAGAGNLSAASDLVAHFYGYPEGSVRVQSAGGQNVIMQVQGDDGEWRNASQRAHPREQFFNSLQNLVDAQGAAARQELSQEYAIAMARVQADLSIASTEQQTAYIQQLMQNGREHEANQLRAALASTESRMYVNQETGGAYVTGVEVGEDGVPRRTVDYISMEDTPVPDTNGRQTEERPVSRRVTGTAGVTTR